MDNTSNACFFGSVKEDLRIGNGLLKGERAMGETNPVRIIKCTGAHQAFNQFTWFIKIEGKDAQLFVFAKWMRIVGVPCQSAYVLTHCQQAPCNVLARVAKSAVDHFHFLCLHANTSSIVL